MQRIVCPTFCRWLRGFMVTWVTDRWQSRESVQNPAYKPTYI